jgi:hypothetical protein
MSQRTPRETAALLMAWLESHGAEFSLTPAGHLRTNLDGCGPCEPETLGMPPDEVADLIFRYGAEIRQLLAARTVTH